MVRVLSKIDEGLASRKALPAGSNCLLAVSGGRDSMVLLRLLTEWAPSRRWRLVVAHYHHQLRVEADDDARFVAAEAAAMGWECVTGTGSVRDARRKDESIEMAARRLRHDFLALTARERGCEWIATGHHGGDQTELFLLRLLRGAGPAGLGGMDWVEPSPSDPRVRLVRPLLGCSPAEIAILVREWGVRHREDASNAESVYARNRIRHELIPWLEARFQPALGRVLERERCLLRDLAAMVEGSAREWIGGGNARPFETLPVALQREVLRVQCVDSGIEADFDLIEALRREVGTGVQVGPGSFLRRDGNGRLHPATSGDGFRWFRWETRVCELADAGGGFEFGGGRLAYRFDGPCDRGGSGGFEDGRATGREWFDADRVGRWVRLRHWRPGDRFRPIGLGEDAKLQDLWTNAGVSAAGKRDRVVAENSDGELFWAEGLRVGEVCKLTSSTRRRLSWQWSR